MISLEVRGSGTSGERRITLRDDFYSRGLIEKDLEQAIRNVVEIMRSMRQTGLIIREQDIQVMVQQLRDRW